jgi:hypothetical protein
VTRDYLWSNSRWLNEFPSLRSLPRRHLLLLHFVRFTRRLNRSHPLPVGLPLSLGHAVFSNGAPCGLQPLAPVAERAGRHAVCLQHVPRRVVDADLLALWQGRKLTVMFVTHSIHEAVFLSTRVVMMAARPGRITEQVVIDEPYPRTPDFAPGCGLCSSPQNPVHSPGRGDWGNSLPGRFTGIPHEKPAAQEKFCSADGSGTSQAKLYNS